MVPGTDENPTSPEDIAAFIQQLQSIAAQYSDEDVFGDMFRRADPVLYPPGDRRRYIVRLDLNHAKPPIWRRLQLSSDLRLDRLHDIVQIAMGWTESHLHHFIAGPGKRDWDVAPFLTDFAAAEGDEGIHEADVRLDQVIAKPGDRLHYEYDFGDSWWHTLRLEKVEDWQEGDPEAFCVTGRRSCPPEDVGGMGGYEQALQILAGNTEDVDPDWVTTITEWMPGDFDPEAFDVDEVNEQLAAGPVPPLESVHPIALEILSKISPLERGIIRVITTAAAKAEPLSPDETNRAVLRYQTLLKTVGEGIQLTGAGYLPPRIVATLYEQLGMSREWIGKGNREDQTLPVLWLRESATALGLLRKAKGKLLVTTAGHRLRNDPDGLWQHIVGRLPLGRAHERDAGAFELFNAAIGESESGRSVLPQMADLGWQVQQASHYDEIRWTEPTASVLHTLAHGLDPSGVGLRGNPESQTHIARAILAG